MTAEEASLSLACLGGFVIIFLRKSDKTTQVGSDGVELLHTWLPLGMVYLSLAWKLSPNQIPTLSFLSNYEYLKTHV